MALFDFRCDECSIIFEAQSWAEGGVIAPVDCLQCGSEARQVWLKAPSTKFDSANDFPMELRNAARVQLGKNFTTRKEHDDYCKSNGYEPLSRKEFETRAVSTPKMRVPLADDPTRERRIHEALDKNYGKLLAGELPPQQQPPPSVVAEIKETAEKIQKQLKAAS